MCMRMLGRLVAAGMLCRGGVPPTSRLDSHEGSEGFCSIKMIATTLRNVNDETAATTWGARCRCQEVYWLFTRPANVMCAGVF